MLFVILFVILFKSYFSFDDIRMARPLSNCYIV